MLSLIVRQRYEKNPKMHEFFYFFMQMIKLLSLKHSPQNTKPAGII
jgi:tyrosyl-tRNA synthetase